jgi:chromosomal replication initiator protein
MLLVIDREEGARRDDSRRRRRFAGSKGEGLNESMGTGADAQRCEEPDASRNESNDKDRDFFIMQSGIERGARAGFFFPGNLNEGHEMAASDSADKIFERVKAQLKARLGSEVYSSWFGRMKLAEASPGVVRISVPTAFLKSWINGHYIEMIAELWRQEEPGLLRIEIIVRSATRNQRPAVEAEAEAPRKPMRPVQTALASGTVPSGRAEPAPAPRPAAHAADFRQSVLGSPLDPRYTFQSFIEGPPNRVALAASRAVAESMSRFNRASST